MPATSTPCREGVDTAVGPRYEGAGSLFGNVGEPARWDIYPLNGLPVDGGSPETITGGGFAQGTFPGGADSQNTGWACGGTLESPVVRVGPGYGRQTPLDGNGVPTGEPAPPRYYLLQLQPDTRGYTLGQTVPVYRFYIDALPPPCSPPPAPTLATQPFLEGNIPTLRLSGD